MAASVYVFHDTAVATGLAPALADELAVPAGSPGVAEGEAAAESDAGVVLSGVAVSDSELFGRAESVEVTCGPLFSAEHAAVPATTLIASVSTASRLGAQRKFRMPFMTTAYRRRSRDTHRTRLRVWLPISRTTSRTMSPPCQRLI
ncbi:hypothetical protein ARTHRO9V_100285 [Arthrobacter sp. 9V]|nr:hypothetical protein ARTHRO9V_100285 [Arthrobacter sp. 9V]